MKDPAYSTGGGTLDRRGTINPAEFARTTGAVDGLRIRGVASVEAKWTCTLTRETSGRPAILEGGANAVGRPSKSSALEVIIRAKDAYDSVNDAYEWLDYLLITGGRAFVRSQAIAAFLEPTEFAEGMDKPPRPPGVFHGPWPRGESELDFVERLIEATGTNETVRIRAPQPYEDGGTDRIPNSGASPADDRIFLH
ncbi:MAG: hypothetical protein HEQ23_13240 [Tepidisphaera sp.]